MELVYSGKVRDLYSDGDDLIMVASDRVSVYDAVLPTPIPDKGRVLTQLSLWWFGQLTQRDRQPRHLWHRRPRPVGGAGDQVPQAAGCCRWSASPAGTWPVSGWCPITKPVRSAACACRPVSGEGSSCPEPVFTPTTKAAAGHDEADDLCRADLARRRSGGGRAASGSRWRSTGAARSWLPRAASSSPTPSWSSGWRDDGTLMLADEVLTPDSSRFWLASEWQPGRPQRFAGQTVPSRLVGLAWTGIADRRVRPSPPEIVAATRDRYLELYTRLTGSELHG